MRQLVDHLVDQVPGVTGALVSSADGFVLASRLPERPDVDPSAVAAMSAAGIGLSNRLVQLSGEARAAFSHHRSDDAQVFVFGVDTVAVLTVLAEPAADAELLKLVGQEIGSGLHRIFRGLATV